MRTAEIWRGRIRHWRRRRLVELCLQWSFGLGFWALFAHIDDNPHWSTLAVVLTVALVCVSLWPKWRPPDIWIYLLYVLLIPLLYSVIEPTVLQALALSMYLVITVVFGHLTDPYRRQRKFPHAGRMSVCAAAQSSVGRQLPG